MAEAGGAQNGPEAGWAESAENVKRGVATPLESLGVGMAQRRWCQRHKEGAGCPVRRD